jgi:methyl-accepting chemotaxis protein
MTIGQKCMAVSGISTGLMLAVGFTGYRGIQSISDSDHEFNQEAQIAMQAASARSCVADLRRYEKDLFIHSQDPGKVREFESKWEIQNANLEQWLKFLHDFIQRPEDQEILEKVSRQSANYAKAMKDHISTIKAGDYSSPQEANQAITPLDEKLRELEQSSEHLADSAKNRMGVLAVDQQAKARTTLVIMGAFTTIAAIVSTGLSLMVARGVTRSLRRMVHVVADLSQGEGDLTKRVPVSGRDELALVAQHFNRFIDQVHDLVSRVQGAAEQVGAASQHLAVTAEQLSAGSQEQASSLEETAASLEEITSSVKQNADNAQQANQLAIGSKAMAEKGGGVVQSAVSAMNEIHAASKKITDIIVTIDELAFQTNLLALNAAVEAARAGEQGRGFAVVAAEVRNLAQRSASAAKEIKNLIGDSVRKVDTGSDLVGKSGQTLQEIVVSVRQVTDLMAEIAATSQEQSSGISQVNRAVAQMDSVVQQNSAQNEEMTSTSQSLMLEAQALQELIRHFKLANQGSNGFPSAEGNGSYDPRIPRRRIGSNGHQCDTLNPGGIHGKTEYGAIPAPAKEELDASKSKPVTKTFVPSRFGQANSPNLVPALNPKLEVGNVCLAGREDIEKKASSFQEF